MSAHLKCEVRLFWMIKKVCNRVGSKYSDDHFHLSAIVIEQSAEPLTAEHLSTRVFSETDGCIM
jgi:hypothetical protein